MQQRIRMRTAGLTLALIAIVIVDWVIGVHGPTAGEATLSDLYFDAATDAWTLSLRMAPGAARVTDAQEWFERALDRLAADRVAGERRIVRVRPGRYVFSRPLIFKAHHTGIELHGAPDSVRALAARELPADRYREEIGTIAPHVPVIDGDGAASFLVVDGVAAARHATTTVSGFYLTGQMAGLGGIHYPDFSYRLAQRDFHRKGGYYTRYAFNDGGVVSVLGNASMTLAHNVIDQPLAYQCGGVLRNEQYGVAGPMPSSRVNGNLVINPFAWHTGAFVDNASGSAVEVTANQVLIDRDMPHEVGLITNFDGGVLVAANNRLVDARRTRGAASKGLEILGGAHSVIRRANVFEGIDIPEDRVAHGSPDFQSDRGRYFLMQRGKALKLLLGLFDRRPFVMPGAWPAEMDAYVRTEG